MKKNFPLTSEKLKPERHVEAIKSEIKKYLARERRKDLPKGANYWEFECKIGPTESEASKIRETDIKPMIDKLVLDQKLSFYLEILATARSKPVAKVEKAAKSEPSR